MPPKTIFTQEQIIDTGLSIVRTGGMQALTARNLAQALGSSTKPIFGLFANMQEVQQAVLSAANACYQSYIANAIAASQALPYKASGLAYIQFAREEQALFQLLFMRDRSTEAIRENREDIAPLLSLIQDQLGIDPDAAYRFHLEMWIYVHGFATMIATNYLPWDKQFISSSLTDIYQGLCLRYKEYSK